MSPGRRRVEVVIDEIVLHGFPPSHRDGVAAAVQAELAASLAGWSTSSGSVTDQLDAGSFTLAAAASPAAVGQGVARLVHRSLPGLGAGPAGTGPERETAGPMGRPRPAAQAGGH